MQVILQKTRNIKLPTSSIHNTVIPHIRIFLKTYVDKKNSLKDPQVSIIASIYRNRKAHCVGN